MNRMGFDLQVLESLVTFSQQTNRKYAQFKTPRAPKPPSFQCDFISWPNRIEENFSIRLRSRWIGKEDIFRRRPGEKRIGVWYLWLRTHLQAALVRAYLKFGSALGFVNRPAAGVRTPSPSLSFGLSLLLLAFVGSSARRSVHVFWFAAAASAVDLELL